MSQSTLRSTCYSNLRVPRPVSLFYFFFNDTATTEIYTLSLHDALPIYYMRAAEYWHREVRLDGITSHKQALDRKSTRLNSSHDQISYAVFCLKKKKIVAALIVMIRLQNTRSYICLE